MAFLIPLSHVVEARFFGKLYHMPKGLIDLAYDFDLRDGMKRQAPVMRTRAVGIPTTQPSQFNPVSMEMLPPATKASKMAVPGQSPGPPQLPQLRESGGQLAPDLLERTP